MKFLLTLLTVLASLLAQPVSADISPATVDLVHAAEGEDGTGKPPTEEEEPDCE